MISESKLEDSVAESGVMRIGELIKTAAFPHVHPDQPLHLVLERMGSAGIDLLPVVSRANTRSLLGVVALVDLLRALGVPERSQD